MPFFRVALARISAERIKGKGREDSPGGCGPKRSCLPSVVIKGFKPLGNGRTKSERNKCFFVLFAEVIIDKALFSRRSGATKLWPAQCHTNTAI